MKHCLKIEPNYLENLKSGIKKVEIRYNDRDYQLGDLLEFNDYSETGINTIGIKKQVFRITHIHSGLGMKEGYVALSVEQEKEE